MGIVPFLIALIILFIGKRCDFAQKLCFTKKAANDKKISFWLEPFHNAIIRIESGGHNHIFIMDNFFRFQKQSIICIRAEIKNPKQSKINTAWNKYEDWYKSTAKGQIHSLFSAPEKKELDVLKKHMADIIEEIKKLKD